MKQLAKNTVGNEDSILVFELRTYLDLQSEMKNIHTNKRTVVRITPKKSSNNDALKK